MLSSICFRALVEQCDDFLKRTINGQPFISSQSKSVAPESKSGLSQVSATIIAVAVLAPIYGIVMGSYAGVSGERPFPAQLWQILYSAIKMPMLVFVTALVSTPSFFVLNTIFGLRSDFRIAITAVWSSLASFAAILCALSPLVMFCYFSLPTSPNAYRLAIVLNATVFSIAAVGSQFVLFRSYRRLIGKDARHCWTLAAWCVAFAFTGIQLGWTLRPFIGNPVQEVTFFRKEAIGNAYLEVWNIVLRVIEDLLF